MGRRAMGCRRMPMGHQPRALRLRPTRIRPGPIRPWVGDVSLVFCVVTQLYTLYIEDKTKARGAFGC